MRVLHISDLHLSVQHRKLGESLRDLWAGPARAIARLQPFDFVVISGDLTQRAHASEYQELHDFLVRDIEPLVKAPDGESKKPRVILVPGNHDVDWAADVYRPIDLGSQTAAQIESYVTEAVETPEMSRVRMRVSRLGHVSLFSIDPSRYAERFTPVQEFLDAYYDGALVGDHRPFRLKDPADAWSAHVFSKERVAFLGFNSCHENDRYWHGARIFRTAMTNARDHVNHVAHREKIELLRAAVWHHGFESHPCRPDRLLLEDLAQLAAHGVRVGFHGHIHQSLHAIHQFIANDFALVSTGSLGASRDDLPETGKQFSTVDLQWNRAHVTVHQHRNGEYQRGFDRYLYFNQAQRPELNRPLRSCAREVVRSLVLDDVTGIAEIAVDVRGLYLVEPIVLAHPPHSMRCAIAPTVKVDGERVNLALPSGSDGSTTPVCDGQRFVFPGKGLVDQYQDVGWSYRLSNAFALNAAELDILEDRRVSHPHLPAGYEAWGHVVQFDYDRLVMKFSCDRRTRVGGDSTAPGDDRPGPYIAAGARGPDVDPIVERRGPDSLWHRVEMEERRCYRAPEPTGAGFELQWDAPVVGYRYGAMFRLEQRGNGVAEEIDASIAAVMDLMRSDRDLGAELRRRATDFTRAFVSRAFSVTDNDWGRDINVVGALWHGRSRELRPCFGEFPPSSWTRSFRGGQGIAGYAYRFARPAAWHRDVRGDYDLIKSPASLLRDHRWILCLPLLARPSGPAVGVIGFASPEDTSKVSRELSDLALRIARITSPSNYNAADFRKLTELWVYACVALWSAVHSIRQRVPKHVATNALHCLREFRVDPAPDDVGR